MAYRPKNPSPTEQGDAGNASIPFGVRLLALLAGTVFLLLSAKSVTQDLRLYYKLTHLDELYVPTPATWLKVDIRRDASGKFEYYPDILFDAPVNGQSVWGWRLSLEEMPGDSAYWVSRLAPYHVGDTVTAYVNPLDPKDSFIEKKHEGVQRVISKALLGAAFGLFGGTLVVLALLGFLRKAGASGPGGGKVKKNKK
jgi:hypothetical protein